MPQSISPEKLRELLKSGAIKIELDPVLGRDVLSDHIFEVLQDVADSEPHSRVFDRMRDPYDRFHDRTESR